MKALVLDGNVVDIHPEGFEVHNSMKWHDCPDHVKAGFLHNGKEFLEKAPDERTLDEHISAYEPYIDMHIHYVAVDKGYQDAATLASYRSSKFKPWADEAVSFIDWRDDVYNYYYNFVKRLRARELAPMNPIDLVNKLPMIVWPKND